MKYPQLSQKQIDELKHNGHTRVSLPLNEDIMSSLINRDWVKLDLAFQRLSCENGEVFKLLQTVSTFKEIENIISIRDAKNEWEEEGIWHDDGSRVLAFSLGLNLKPETIKGGELLFRKKRSESLNTIFPIKYGEIIIFKTGVEGYEHKVTAVTEGERIIIAGWCS